jgi:peptidoglycan hydrolase CwlO-like protein
MSDQLNARNIQAIAQALRDMNDRVGELTVKVNSLQTTCAELQTKLNVTTQELTIMRVRSQGRGPTS